MMSGSRFVACPICNVSVPKLLINSHLDSADCRQASAPPPGKRQRLVVQESGGAQEGLQSAAAKAVQLKATEPFAWLRFPGVRTKAPVLSHEDLQNTLPCEVRPVGRTESLSAAHP